MESLPIRRAPGVLVLVVAIMLQASTQICLGRQILATGSAGPSDDETSTTQEVNYDKVQTTLNSPLLVLRSLGLCELVDQFCNDLKNV
jgi:hypothetical protein